MKCPNCRMKIPNGANICPYCHSEVNGFGIFGDMYDDAKEGYKKGSEWGANPDNLSTIALSFTTGGIGVCTYTLMYGDGLFSTLFLVGAIASILGTIGLYGFSDNPKALLILSIILGVGAIFAYGWFERKKTTNSKEDNENKKENVEMTSETSNVADEPMADFFAVAEDEPIPKDSYIDAIENVDKGMNNTVYQDLATNNEEVVQETSLQANDDEVLDVVEQMPSFPRGETA